MKKYNTVTEKYNSAQRTSPFFFRFTFFICIFLWLTASVQCLAFPKAWVNAVRSCGESKAKTEVIWKNSVLLVLESEGHIKSKWMDSSLVTSVFSKVVWSSLTVVTRRASQGSWKRRDKNSCQSFSDSQGWEDEIGTHAHLTPQRGKKEITA